MANIKAKFWVESVKRTTGGSEVCLRAVCRGEDNKLWSAYTPSGSLTMVVLNQLAAAEFEPGEEFYLTFEHAPKGQPGM